MLDKQADRERHLASFPLSDQSVDDVFSIQTADYNRPSQQRMMKESTAHAESTVLDIQQLALIDGSINDVKEVQ